MNHLTSNLTPASMGWTYGEIVDYFSSRFDEDQPNVRLVIKSVLSEIISRHDWKWLRSSDIIATQDGLAAYPLAGDCTVPDGDMFISANRRVVERVDLNKLRAVAAERGEASGMPDMFAVVNEDTVIFSPTPDAAYSVLYDYTVDTSINVEDESDSPPMPRAFQHILMSGVEETMRMDDDRIDAATTIARRKFEAQLLNMIWRQDSADKARSQPDVLPPSAY